jgi:DNA-binding XRE family transcriptional regulator
MREARRLCEHTITQAAALLGVTQGDLKNIENVADVDHVPLWLIKNASEVFNVPTDYLFGLIDDFDSHDPEVFKGRSLIASLQRQQLEDFTKSASEQIKQDGRLKAINTAVVAFGLAVQQISEVFTQFRRLNYVAFDNMPGSARVLRQIQLAEELGQHATVALTKYKCLPESLAAHAVTMDEIFPNNNGSFSD